MLDDPVQWGSRSWLPAAEGGSGVAEAGWEKFEAPNQGTRSSWDRLQCACSPRRDR